MLIIVSEWRVQGVQVVFPTAGRFVQGVQTIFHYCGTLCTGCTNHFPLLRDVLYRVYEPFRISVFQCIAPAPPSRSCRKVSPLWGARGLLPSDSICYRLDSVLAAKYGRIFGR